MSRELASIANALTRSFVSRNNDIDGWWGMGVLLTALPSEDRSLTLDLLLGVSIPDLSSEPSGLRVVAQAWARRFRGLVDQHHVRVPVTTAALTLRFEPSERRSNDLVLRAAQRGTASPQLFQFRCEVAIANARGRTFSAAAEGICYPHDPTTELRSGGPNRVAQDQDLLSAHSSSDTERR